MLFKFRAFTKLIFRLNMSTSNNSLKTERPLVPVLKFWFGDDLEKLKSHDYAGNNALWWGGSVETDNLIRAKFGQTLKDAESGLLNDWKSEAQGSVALILLLDQFSRNLYRNSARMFSNDAQALAVTLELMADKSKLSALSLSEKMFVYMPLMHSEDLAMLKLCQQAFDELVEEAPEARKQGMRWSRKFCQEHYDIVEKFGRFPHRNEILNRTSTPAEQEFCEKNDHGFTKVIRAKPAAAEEEKS